MKNALSLMTVCSVLLTLVARGQVAPAENSKTGPVDPGNVTAGLTASTSPPAGNSPVITRVSPILPRSNQTIVIEGSGFGNSPPKLVPVGDAVDTDVRNGQRPALAIGNHGRGADAWQAGLARDGDVNALGVKLESWTDTKITLAGFGNALGDEQSDATWRIAAGDPIEIMVFGPANSEPAKFATTVTTLPADHKTRLDEKAVARAEASSESENLNLQILFNQWLTSLPALVVWTVGLILAVKRWRERPQISKLVAISCSVALLTLILMPVAMQVGNKINFNGAILYQLLAIVGACLGALSIGLLLKAVFVERGQSDLPAPEQPDQSGPAVITGPMGTALEKMDQFLLTPPNRGLATTLKILAGIVRWTWRIISIGATLFVGVFLLASLHPGTHLLPRDPEDIAAVIVGIFFFAAMVLAWWREGLGGLIMLLIVPFVAVLTVVMNWHAHKSGAEVIAAAKDCLGLTVPPGTILFSWSLHTLNDRAVPAWKRRLAALVALVFVVPVALLLWQVFSHPLSLIPANG